MGYYVNYSSILVLGLLCNAIGAIHLYGTPVRQTCSSEKVTSFPVSQHLKVFQFLIG